MKRQEADEPEVCAICHEELADGDERDYRAAASTVVCHECARKLGGVYSADKEAWTVAPKLPRRNIVGGEEG
jgi:hypothetical protein